LKKTERIKVKENLLSKTDLKGCLYPLIWSDIPPLDKNLLNELMDSGLLDFLTDKREETAEPSRIYQEIT
jgi:hypothetical protein